MKTIPYLGTFKQWKTKEIDYETKKRMVRKLWQSGLLLYLSKMWRTSGGWWRPRWHRRGKPDWHERSVWILIWREGISSLFFMLKKNEFSLYCTKQPVFYPKWKIWTYFQLKNHWWRITTFPAESFLNCFQ